jgi:hypothetical protein
MFRDGTAANAATVILDTRPDGNIEFMARLCAGCAMQFLGTARVTLPAELILINDSGHFTASVSQTDSAHAATIGTVDVSMSAPAFGFCRDQPRHEPHRDGRVRDPEPELVLGPVRPRMAHAQTKHAITRPPWLVRVQANRMYR